MSAATSPATSAQPEIDAEELKRTALDIYRTLIGRRGGPNPDQQTVIRAFQLARQFLRTTAGILAGDIRAEPPTEDKPEYFVNDIWFLVSDDGAKQEWRPMLTEEGDVLQERQLYDQDCVHFNLPRNHPLNRRYKPRPGAQTLDELFDRHEADKKAARERDFDMQRLDKVSARLMPMQPR